MNIAQNTKKGLCKSQKKIIPFYRGIKWRVIRRPVFPYSIEEISRGVLLFFIILNLILLDIHRCISNIIIYSLIMYVATQLYVLHPSLLCDIYSSLIISLSVVQPLKKCIYIYINIIYIYIKSKTVVQPWQQKMSTGWYFSRFFLGKDHVGQLGVAIGRPGVVRRHIWGLQLLSFTPGFSLLKSYHVVMGMLSP